VLLTAKAEEEDRLLGVKAGADFYITKPFNVIELIGKIKEILDRKNGTHY
jgi:DNA-binding response OmpR family regulator